MIKLLALDLDGTTLDPRGQVTERVREAIRAAESSGVLVTIATGRRFRDARPVGIDLELNAPLITHNGALIKFAESFKTVASSLLGHDTCLDVIRLGRTLGGDPLVSTDPHGLGMLLYDRISDDNLPLKKYLRWSESLHGEGPGREGVVHVESVEGVISDSEVVHISFSGSCASMRSLEAELRDGLGDKATTLATIYPHLDFTLLDILPPDASKGHGVRQLAEINGFGADDVMAIGDNFNDLEMLEYAGTAVVMGNADLELQQRDGFHLTASNSDDGVAVAI